MFKFIIDVLLSYIFCPCILPDLLRSDNACVPPLGRVEPLRRQAGLALLRLERRLPLPHLPLPLVGRQLLPPLSRAEPRLLRPQ